MHGWETNNIQCSHRAIPFNDEITEIYYYHQIHCDVCQKKLNKMCFTFVGLFLELNRTQSQMSMAKQSTHYTE